MPGDASCGAARGDELVLPQDLLDGLAPPQPQAVDLEEKPGSDAEASEPGIFAESVSISSTRSAGVSDSAYYIKSIELRPTFDLVLGACRGLHVFGRVPSGETLIVLWFRRTHRLTNQVNPQPDTRGAARGARA
jgi:hypothetical protein